MGIFRMHIHTLYFDHQCVVRVHFYFPLDIRERIQQDFKHINIYNTFCELGEACITLFNQACTMGEAGKNPNSI